MLGTGGPGLHRGNQEAARWRRDQPGHSRQRERTKVCCGHGGLKLPNMGERGEEEESCTEIAQSLGTFFLKT